MKDDNDRLQEGTLPRDPFADADPIGGGVEPSTAARADPASESRHEFLPFPVEALPEPVKAFVTEASGAIRCDPTFVALPLLAGLATAVGNTRRIQLKPTWLEPMILWTAIVGESGTQKSPALDVPMAPLKNRQAKLLAEYADERAEYENKLEEFNDSKRRRSGNDHDGIPGRPVAPTAKRIYCADITIEALAKRLSHSPRGLLLLRDELSAWISSFDQYKSSRGSDAGNWLELFRGGALLVDRKVNDETIHIPRASLCVAGGIQPVVLRGVLGQQHVENGLVARLLLAMPPRAPKVWTDAVVSHSTALRLEGLYEKLFNLEFDCRGDREARPLDLQLTELGREEWIKFVNQHGAEQAARSGALAAAYSKLEGYCARFALLVHLIREATRDTRLESNNSIDVASVRAAVTMTRWFAHETERIYETLNISTSAVRTRSLLETLEGMEDGITVRELMRTDRKYRGDATLATTALDNCVKSGLGRWELRPPSLRGGRPTRVFHLNRRGSVRELGEIFPPTRIGTQHTLNHGDSGDGDTTSTRMVGGNGQTNV